jgi:hypothetical protein
LLVACAAAAAALLINPVIMSRSRSYGVTDSICCCIVAQCLAADDLNVLPLLLLLCADPVIMSRSRSY